MKDLLLVHFVPQYVIVYICNKNKHIPWLIEQKLGTSTKSLKTSTLNILNIHKLFNDFRILMGYCRKIYYARLC